MFKPSVICSKSKSSNHYVIRFIVFRCQFVLHSCSPCLSITVVDIQNHLLLGFRGRIYIVPRFRRDFPSGAFSYSATPSGVGSSHTSSLAKLTPAADNKCSSFLYLQFQGDGGVWSEQTFYFRTKNSGLRTHCL